MIVIYLFVIIQIILLLFMTFHDWIHLPPLTDIREIEKHSTITGRVINSIIFFFLIFIPLSLTLFYQPNFPCWVLGVIVFIYGLLSLGTIFSWWMPYIRGSSQEHKEGFKEYRNTHHFLSARGDNVVPNTLHVILHVQIWACLGISIYLLLAYQNSICTNIIF